MSNTIIGLAETCYKGVVIIRGYATSKSLVQYSKKYSSYQRDKTPEHVQAIKDYIDTKDTVFMPEIILSYNYYNLCSDNPRDFFEIFRGHPIVRDNVNGMIFRNLKHKSSEDKIFKIELPKSEDKKPFSRIDGNHRLEAMSELEQELKVPYCIVLFCSQSDNEDDSEIKKREMSIFHNLNAKGKILSTEEQYKGLFNIFDNEELKAIAPELIPVKEFAEKRCDGKLDKLQSFLCSTYPGLKLFFANPLEVLIEIFKITNDSGKNISDIELHDLLSFLNLVFESHKSLIKSKSVAILYAYAFFARKLDKCAKKKVKAFTRWLCSSQIYHTEKIDAESLIKIFTHVYDNINNKIFVAMPFDPNLDFVFKIIKRSIDKINKEFDLAIPEPVRIDKQIEGFSYDIPKSILRHIREAKLVIADLTNQNANVYYEAGYAQGLIHAKLGNTAQILYLISNPQNPDDPFAAGKFDVNHYKMIPYKNTGNGTAELEENLIKELKAFYGIGGE